MEFFWRRAGHGLYILRDHPGYGPGVGRVTSIRTQGSGASIYSAAFDYRGHVLTFSERGQPKTVMALLEADIRKHIPDATFTRKDF